MAEGSALLASAVIIPETEEEPNSPNPSAKRRLSSVSLSPSKRSRVSADQDEAAINTQTSIIPGFGGARARQASKDVDERKRGKRLFGALLGTLANNSSSTIQRRRVDIEKKQKEKLKLQAEEDDQQKKSRLDNLMQARRQEQKKYDRQSMLIRHSSTLAMARFLQTEAEPRLYYKPWELLPEQESGIKSQINEAEAAIDHELRAQQAKREVSGPSDTAMLDLSGNSTDGHPKDKETVGDATNEREPVKPSTITDANIEHVFDTNEAPADEVKIEISKDTPDDGGDDVVEGEEDAVIY